MDKLREFCGKYPITTKVSSYFTATFAGTGSVAWMFERPIEQAIFISAVMGITFGIVGAVKVLDKDSESE